MSSAPRTDPAAHPVESAGPPFSWAAALAQSVLAFIALVFAFLVVPQLILTGPSWPDREARLWLVVAWVALAFSVFSGLAWRMTAPGRPGDAP